MDALTLEPLRGLFLTFALGFQLTKQHCFHWTKTERGREGERGGGPMRQSSEMVGGNIFDIGTNSP